MVRASVSSGLSRRRFLAGSGVAGLAGLMTACGLDGGQTVGEAPALRGRLRFRPGEPVNAMGRTGTVKLGGSESAPVLGYVPPATNRRPLRLVVLLHGAGGNAHGLFDRLRPFADEQHLLLVAPKAQQKTWDVIVDDYGPDVRRIDQVLQEVCVAYPVRGLTIAGFSDGASYALSLGLTNGDIFDSVMAFSPGFTAASQRHGRPRLFVSHGRSDDVLPIDRCSRQIVPRLQETGYDVTYREFNGGHALPPDIVSEAVSWLSRS